MLVRNARGLIVAAVVAAGLSAIISTAPDAPAAGREFFYSHSYTMHVGASDSSSTGPSAAHSSGNYRWWYEYGGGNYY